MEFSILNLATVREGQTYKEAIEDMIVLAKKAEKFGYDRYWIAEHHNMKAVTSSATVLLMQQVLANTKTIRVGSGGIMLPNHSPYIVAEQIGTLEVQYPNRVDLGVGRAPGTDIQTAKAIRRTHLLNPNFEDDVQELMGYFSDTNAVHAYPAAHLAVPFYILGSSTDSAYLAAKLGLPYAFASHFAPAMLEEAVAIYRRLFRPSDMLKEPYVIVGANVYMADNESEAACLKTSHTQLILDLITGAERGIQPPKESEEAVWYHHIDVTKVPNFGPIAFEREDFISREKKVVKNMQGVSFVGDIPTVQQQVLDLKQRVDFDELIVTSSIYDKEAQYRSYQLFAEAMVELNNRLENDVVH